MGTYRNRHRRNMSNDALQNANRIKRRTGGEKIKCNKASIESVFHLQMQAENIQA